MSGLTEYDIKNLERSVRAGIDGTFKGYTVKSGEIYERIDDLHSIDEWCGDCWRRISIEELGKESGDTYLDTSSDTSEDY